VNIVVTGAAGFIGSHACERLAAAGHDVVGLLLGTRAFVIGAEAAPP